jgi:cellulose synthase operon protein C
MRNLNVRLLIVIVVVAGLLVGSTHLLHSFQIQRNSSVFKIQAKAAWDDNPRRAKDALTLMGAYLGLEPGDLSARQDLGFWKIELGQFKAGSSILEEVLRSLERQTPPDKQTPDEKKRIQEIRRKLVDSAMVQGRFEDALDHLRFLHHELKGDVERDVDLLNLMGKCLISLGREDGPEGAIAMFSQAVALDPKRVDIYYRKAMALLFPRRQRDEEARKCMAEMIAYWDQRPDEDKNLSAGAHHVYALWLSEQGEHEEALKQSLKTLNIVKDHPGALYLAGKSELALGKLPEAEDYARRGMAAGPHEYSMYTLMADIRVRENQRDKAIEVLKQGVAAAESNSAKANILWNLANFYLDGRSSSDAKDIAAAIDCMARLREYRFSQVELDFLDARVLYANDDWKAAREGFERVRPKMNEFPQLMKCLEYWTGYCYLQQGNPDQASQAFHRALNFDRFYFKAHDGLAQIYLGNGQYDKAAEEYRQAAAGDAKDIEAWMAWGRTLVRWYLTRPKGQDWGPVKEVLRHAYELNPRNGEIPLLGAEILAAEGNLDQASRIVQGLGSDAPKSVEIRVAMANMAARQGHVDQARKILQDAKAELGDQVPLRLAQSVYFMHDLGRQAGPDIENLASRVESFSLADKTHLWTGLLANLLEIREFDRAKRIARLIARAQPHDAMIRYRLLELELVTHDARNPESSLAELDGVLAEIDRIAGQGPLWLYGKAVRLMLESQQGKPELLNQAWDYAEKAKKERVNWSRPDVLQGEICRQRGNDEMALHCYLQASYHGDQDLDFIRLLLQMLFERQRYQEAAQVAQRLDRSQTPLNAEIGKEVAQIFVYGGDFHRALEYAIKNYNPSSDDYHEHVWQGQILTILARRARQEGHPDQLQDIKTRGEKALLRACLLAPNAADARVMWVQFLMATDQKDKALAAASDAELMIPQESSSAAMGYIYEALGETDKARQRYEKAVQLKPDMPRTIRLLADFYVRNHQPQLATPLIDRLMSSAVNAGESDLVAARRLKANILFEEGYPRFQEAIALVDRNLASSLAVSDDRRLKIRILLADPRQARGQEVLDLCESLVATGSGDPDPDDRFRLASVCLARGNWARCREQMQKLVNSNQSQPRFLSAYVRMLLDQDELPDAELWLDQLQRVSPPSQTIALQAELLFRKKEWAKVPVSLADYIEQEKAEPQRLERVLVCARLLEDLGGRLTSPAERKQAQAYFEKARQWYESYVQKLPGHEMLLAGFLARRGNLEPALGLLEHFGAKASPLDLGIAADAAIRSEKITPQQLSRVEKVLTAAAAAHKSSIPLLNALTSLKICQGDFAAAEEFCRQTIAADPKNYLAYNNLGVLLSFAGGKSDEALAHINRAIELAGPQPLLLDSRAVIHLSRNEAQQALEDLASISADKLDPVWVFHKARALWMTDQIKEAAAALAEARNQGLDISKIDPPERPRFDELQKRLLKQETQP